MTIEIRNYKNSDLQELVDLFTGAVRSVASLYYNMQQIEAWAPCPPDIEKWRQRFQITPPIVAIIDKKIAGFSGLTNEGHIEWMFTHKDYQRKGVATALHRNLRRKATSMGFKTLSVHASLVAKPFFQRYGFQIVSQNSVCLGNVSLTNFTMQCTW